MERGIEFGQQRPPGFVIVERRHTDSGLAGGDGMHNGASAGNPGMTGRAKVVPGALPGICAAAHDIQRMTLYRETGPDHLPPDTHQ